MTHVRWIVCALLFFATTINYVDRQILALIKEFADRELGWSNEQFGLVNSAFSSVPKKSSFWGAPSSYTTKSSALRSRI